MHLHVCGNFIFEFFIKHLSQIIWFDMYVSVCVHLCESIVFMYVYSVFVNTGRPITALNRVGWNCGYSSSSHGLLEVVYLSVLPRRPITALNRVGWNVGYSSSSHGLPQVECCDWLIGQHADRQLFILFYCLTWQLVNTLMFVCFLNTNRCALTRHTRAWCVLCWWR